jgi:GTP-binding protein HflX
LTDVEDILRQLGIDPHNGPANKQKLIEVWNKVDRLDADEQIRLANLAERRPADARPVLVSAITGQGLDVLAATIETRLAEGRPIIVLELDASDGAGVSWLHRHTEVIGKTVNEQTGSVAMTVRVDASRAAEVRARFAH